MKLTFSGAGLAFLSHFKADHDIRYYLCGIYLEPMPPEAGGGVLGAASNGHVMGMWHDKDGHVDRPVIMSISKQLAQACKKPGAKLLNRDGRLTAAAMAEKPATAIWDEAEAIELFVQANKGKATIDVQRKIADRVQQWEIEAIFPDISRAVARTMKAGAAPDQMNLVNAAYLSLMEKALPKPSVRRSFANSILIRQPVRNESMVLTCMEHPQALALIMPMRDHGSGPGWVDSWVASKNRHAAAVTAPLPAMPSDAVPPPEFRPVKIGRKKPGSYTA